MFDVKEKYYPNIIISPGNIVKILRRMLSDIDPLFMDVAERTAFLVMKIVEKGNLQNRFDMQSLFLLSLFFNIGSYRFPTQKKATDYLVKQLSDQTLYSYLFLKHMCTIGDIAETVFFHHTDYEKVKKIDSPYAEYASLIFTCARISIQIKENNYKYTDDWIRTAVSVDYSTEYTELFLECDKNLELTTSLKDGSFFNVLDSWCDNLKFNEADTAKILNMLIYSIDFKSTTTLTHCLNVAQYAAEIAKAANFSSSEIDEMFIAGVLHDVGKMAIPNTILESPEKLDESQMIIMRTHVQEGNEIIRGLISDKIADIAVRHHETLDGKGYPYHLSGEELTLQQRALTIADLASALTDARSYKMPFSKEKTITLMQKAAANGKLDSSLVNLFVEHYDNIMAYNYIDRTPLIASFGRITLDFSMLDGYTDVSTIISMIHESNADSLATL